MGYNKDDAFAFFIALESTLNHSLPNPSAMKKEMLNICNEGASEHRIRENQFLYHFVMPLIHKQMQTVPGIGPGEARHALLCEYHAKISDISSGNAMRRAGSPFGKAIGRLFNRSCQTGPRTTGASPSIKPTQILLFGIRFLIELSLTLNTLIAIVLLRRLSRL
jgi:hypothetical protein